ncbi:YqiA/YcfP family alpha/beta fold hydrolase [Pseudidiomarina donghaiensis]|uniref:Esterase YqiA n=1 Tax=Pseudidiomarina donghaiensis TaxID=519452 RepID=A0A432XE71_9GAMM|nr:YqiA/YcfP family alpha/beta fold hydrolase [Pseudidiomarina donghaiensis]RUO47041.1 hypothetical protein CWE24_09950 [Pseudidiomarina donghaiensis]SFV23517.1 hypothetical protein SAMN04488139_1814 [Pseudidiomarina donghaiensis]
MLLYLHGFESSPESLKIIQTREFINSHQAKLPYTTKSAVQLLAPQQPSRMSAIRQVLDELVASQPLTAVMGSSLGGFWTHYVVSQLHQRGRTDVRGVLINPAVQPYNWMPEEAVDRVHPYTQEAYQLDASDRQVLIEAEQSFVDEADLLVLLQAGDERLDYRLARDYYRRQRMVVEQGGDHSFIDFPRYLPAALEFLHVL